MLLVQSCLMPTSIDYSRNATLKILKHIARCDILNSNMTGFDG